MEDLKGKVVIVTGASSGIGLATAEALLTHGAKVLGTDLSPAPSTSSADFHFLQANLVDASTPDKIVEACISAFGPKIDALLNVAGIPDQNSSVDSLTDGSWDKAIAVNLTAPVKLMRAVVPIMISNGGGSIVNVSSKAGMSGAAAGVAYTASKHGIVGVTKNVAWRYKDEGIRCNAICPGAVQTNIAANIDMANLDMKATATLMSVRETIMPGQDYSTVPTADKVANVLVFLTSAMSSELNGAIIPVDHGWSVI
ncbi:related to 3-ketoacyl-acyl carrier protein reductase [Phialocephala subalpina]|uniref:Related to 3-ketoacyl-acyl carrier protein reductase n=1 Tax=Phialocephala subalpina TaxID=576137 RepID=A0A1L7XW13_9HELO|nr:related to 3-ketoacyl-acyl carrier protein reductase [Phialocephala subalpina]